MTYILFKFIIVKNTFLKLVTQLEHLQDIEFNESLTWNKCRNTINNMNIINIILYVIFNNIWVLQDCVIVLSGLLQLYPTVQLYFIDETQLKICFPCTMDSGDSWHKWNIKKWYQMSIFICWYKVIEIHFKFSHKQILDFHLCQDYQSICIC